MNIMFVIMFYVSDRVSLLCDLKHFEYVYHVDAPFGVVQARKNAV